MAVHPDDLIPEPELSPEQKARKMARIRKRESRARIAKRGPLPTDLIPALKKLGLYQDLPLQWHLAKAVKDASTDLLESWEYEYDPPRDVQVWTNISDWKFCVCGEPVKRPRTRCKACAVVTQELYRQSEKGAAAIQARLLRKGLLRSDFTKVVLETIRELREEAQKDQKLFRQLEELANINATIRRKYERAFLGKIFQPFVCADCGAPSETLHPPVIASLGIDTTKGSKWDGRQRCRPCAKKRRNAVHGHGPRERCEIYGVPYENISPAAVFIRDEYICQICGDPIKRDAHYLDPLAPEVDHIWPLSVVVNGVKSPGHVMFNLQTAHRKCNGEKSDEFGVRDILVSHANHFYAGLESLMLRAGLLRD